MALPLCPLHTSFQDECHFKKMEQVSRAYAREPYTNPALPICPPKTYKYARGKQRPYVKFHSRTDKWNTARKRYTDLAGSVQCGNRDGGCAGSINGGCYPDTFWLFTPGESGYHSRGYLNTGGIGSGAYLDTFAFSVRCAFNGFYAI